MKCATKYCRNDKARNRTVCLTCQSKKYRQNNPMRYAFYNLKSNAKRRGKVFEISFEYFKKFAIEHDYLGGKGITKKAYHVDRIDENKGYIEGNLQLKTNTENGAKYRRWKTGNYNQETGEMEFSNFTDELDYDFSNVPF